MAWGFESNRITTMRYIVMITKLNIEYALIKIDTVLPKLLRHNLQQLLNYLPEIGVVKDKHSSHRFAKYVKLYFLPNYQVTCTKQNMYATFRINNHLSALHNMTICNRANNKNMSCEKASS